MLNGYSAIRTATDLLRAARSLRARTISRAHARVRHATPARTGGRRRRLFISVVAWGFVAFGANVRGADAPPKTIVFFGDSLTAGYGLEDPTTDAFPARIQSKIDAARLPYRVVNAGLSGETTAGGLRRVDWILRQPIDVFVLALGGNDGLRGIEPSVSEANLQGIIDKVRRKDPQASIVLLGLKMPPSMGEDYARSFASMYPDLARRNHTALVPFLLENVGAHAGLNQADGIHPTAKGHAVLAENVWKVLRPLL